MQAALNYYRDEAGRFLAAKGATDEPVTKILEWLGEEVAGLRAAAIQDKPPELQHQIYDVMFLLFELAAMFDLDLDAEWSVGRERKRKKYPQ